MNSFSACREIEAKSWEILKRYLVENAEGGMYVKMDKGALAPFLQKVLGDVIFNRGDSGSTCTVEIKAEEKWTGNVFLEVWSNRNLDDFQSYMERGSTPGWFLTNRATFLMNHFLDENRLLIMNMFKLKQWAFGHHSEAPGLHSVTEEWRIMYPEVPQKKNAQRNDTFGRLVPVTHLKKHLGQYFHQVDSIDQLELPGISKADTWRL